jgi:hypothetical protein
MGLYDEIAGAAAARQSTYVSAGTYVAVVGDWKEGVRRQGDAFVVLEMTVLASDNHEKHPVGSAMSWMVMLKHDSAPGNIKRAIMEIVALQEEGQVTSDLCKAVLTPNEDEERGEVGVSPTAGTIIDVVATTTKTRAGNDFTRVTFRYRDPDRTVEPLEHRPRHASGGDDGLADAVPF